MGAKMLPEAIDEGEIRPVELMTPDPVLSGVIAAEGVGMTVLLKGTVEGLPPCWRLEMTV